MKLIDERETKKTTKQNKNKDKKGTRGDRRYSERMRAK